MLGVKLAPVIADSGATAAFRCDDGGRFPSRSMDSITRDDFEAATSNDYDIIFKYASPSDYSNHCAILRGCYADVIQLMNDKELTRACPSIAQSAASIGSLIIRLKQDAGII